MLPFLPQAAEAPAQHEPGQALPDEDAAEVQHQPPAQHEPGQALLDEDADVRAEGQHQPPAQHEPGQALPVEDADVRAEGQHQPPAQHEPGQALAGEQPREVSIESELLQLAALVSRQKPLPQQPEKTVEVIIRKTVLPLNISCLSTVCLSEE